MLFNLQNGLLAWNNAFNRLANMAHFPSAPSLRLVFPTFLPFYYIDTSKYEIELPFHFSTLNEIREGQGVRCCISFNTFCWIWLGILCLVGGGSLHVGLSDATDRMMVIIQWSDHWIERIRRQVFVLLFNFNTGLINPLFRSFWFDSFKQWCSRSG